MRTMTSDEREGLPVMLDRTRSGVIVVACAVLLAGAPSALAQPSGGARGCCCLVQGVTYVCAEKTQDECLALQPAAPTFAKIADWKKAVEASKAQAARPMKAGWIGESCEKAEARPGCCCFPKLHPTQSNRFDCKSGITEFDCRAVCSMFKDGRQPSGCTWALGSCP